MTHNARHPRTKPLLALLTLTALASAAQAHQIWIEQPAGQPAVVRFGEFAENLREASPGLLDKFGKPVATLVTAQGSQTADASKSATGFALPFKAARGQSIVAEDARYPLYTWKQGDKATVNWFYPAARLVTDLSAQTPQLPLDLVPTGTLGQFKLFYQGQALPKAKVNLVVQSGWAKEGHTDAQGLVSFDMPWQGTYVAEVSHNEAKGGERPGVGGVEKFDAVSYVTTLTYVKAVGLVAVPAGPAGTPGQ